MKETKRRLGLVGATGRMGRQVLACLKEQDHWALSAVLCRPERLSDYRRLFGQNPDVTLSDDVDTFVQAVDVVLDFSAPTISGALAGACERHGRGCVIASTGLSATDDAALVAASKKAAVLVAANTSLGINAMLPLVFQAAQMLRTWDVEIVEAHHRLKRDAPSGTALRLGEACVAGRPSLAYDTCGVDRAVPRPNDVLGFSVVRAGDIAGEHTVLFAGEQERIEITHRATTPMIFARGALFACSFVLKQKPGHYSMTDALSESLTSAPKD